MKTRILVTLACLGWFAVAWAAGSAAESPSFLTKDWLLGGALGALNVIAIGYIRKIDKKLDRHDERISGQDVRLAEGEGRMNQIQALCMERHKRRETDPPGFDSSRVRCHEGERKA